MTLKPYLVSGLATLATIAAAKVWLNGTPIHAPSGGVGSTKTVVLSQVPFDWYTITKNCTGMLLSGVEEFTST